MTHEVHFSLKCGFESPVYNLLHRERRGSRIPWHSESGWKGLCEICRDSAKKAYLSINKTKFSAGKTNVFYAVKKAGFACETLSKAAKCSFIFLIILFTFDVFYILFSFVNLATNFTA